MVLVKCTKPQGGKVTAQRSVVTFTVVDVAVMAGNVFKLYRDTMSYYREVESEEQQRKQKLPTVSGSSEPAFKPSIGNK